MDQQILNLRKQILNDEFSNLNEQQRDAVYSNDGPLLILAGAGSGKTTTVISKIGYLIKYGNTYNSDVVNRTGDDDAEYLKKCLENKDMRDEERYKKLMRVSPIPAYNILAITFTNKAAGEMRDRLDAKYNIDGSSLWALTFHSTCVRLLRRYAPLLGYDKNFTIYDDSDSNKLLENIMKRLNLTERYTPKVAHKIISKAKTQYLTPDEFMYTDSEFPKIQKVYKEYQTELKNANAFDFDDLIFMTVKLLSENETVRKEIHARFKYLLVDEYQDTNPLQYRLVKLLSNNGKICVVGDDDQSIYRFMGASIDNILSFEKQFSGTKTVRLERNYRSTQTILDAANALISNNERRKGKNMWTDSGKGDPIVVNQFATQNEEGEYICKCILEGIGRNEEYSDFCVLYRTNAQSNSLEFALKGNGIPYRIFGGLPFFKRKEVQDILSYLNVINNPYDKTRLYRIINEPKRGIGDATLEKINSISISEGERFYDVLSNARNYPELQRSADKLCEFAAMISMLSEKSKELPVSELFELLIETIDYEGYLRKTYDKSEAGARMDNVRELYNNIVQFEQKAEDKSLLAYLEETALVSAIDNLDENEKAVTLMTMHCAKGLEFDNVFMAGVEEGLFPSPQSVNEDGGIEEERRLCYVAITRARKRLYILSAKARLIYGTMKPAFPSRFIKEIPPELIYEVKKPTKEYTPFVKQYRSSSERQLISGPITSVPKSSSQKQTFTIGQTVKHKAFGVGKIVAVTAMSSDNLVEVDFESVGKKKLMTNYAKLEIMD